MRKKLHNNNGINICDSIVMSVKKKRANIRQFEAVFIAVIGYVATIMSFITMFDVKFSHTALIISGVIFSVLYILLSVAGKKAMWIVAATAVVGIVILYKLSDTISLGYKYVYNVIYRTSMHKEIDYYKLLSPELEQSSITVFFIFLAWLLAIVIYVFTIYRPEIIPPLLVTFPVLEIGLYNGIEISVLWGMLTVAYWFALFAMAVTDSGEYSGGFGGFVRKDNMFFPKRQMRLKVTEKCGMYIIAVILAVTAATSAVLDITKYERSEKLNEKRIEIRDAVNAFSLEDFTGSISQLTSAFGLTFKVQAHRLGNMDKLKYKDTTDLIVTVDNNYNDVLYIKEYTGSVYDNNEWLALDDSAYSDDIFSDFEQYGIYPQDFPYIINQAAFPFSSESDYRITIDSKLRRNRTFSPYGIKNDGLLTYDYDMSAISQKDDKFSYTLSKINTNEITKYDSVNSISLTTEEIRDTGALWYDTIADYLNNKNLMNEYGAFEIKSAFPISYDNQCNLAMLIESDYSKFVYENYLQVPNNADINEIRTAYSEILSREISTNEDKLSFLVDLREYIARNVEYSLNPGRTPNSRDFINYFLLENQKGYCTHYATSGVILARMAGIPARYATGYVIVGDDFNESTQNPDGTYTINVKDNRSHAWAEIYLDGYGWIPFEFTAGYTSRTIDTTPPATTTTEFTETHTTAVETSETETQSTTNETNQSITTTTVSATTQNTSTITTVITSVPEDSDKVPSVIFSILKWTACVIGIILLAASIILIRRMIILMIRKIHFTSGANKSRLEYIYSYTEKLLKYKNYSQKNMSYTEFAEYIEKSLGGVYFPENSFKNLVDISLQNAFSKKIPENSELKECIDFTSVLAENIYKKADKHSKIYLKFIIVLM